MAITKGLAFESTGSETQKKMNFKARDKLIQLWSCHVQQTLNLLSYFVTVCAKSTRSLFPGDETKIKVHYW